MITIRPYDPSDRAACISLFMSNVPQYFAAVELPEFERLLDGLDLERLAYDDTRAELYYVAEQEGRIVACGGFCVYATENKASLAWGMVDRAVHRKGIGKEFALFRINTIRANWPECSLVLDTTQHSFPFFERLGFKVVKIIPDFYASGMDRYDMVLPGAL